MLSIMSYGVGYPFGELGSAVLAVSPPSFLCPPRLLAGGVGEAEKALTLCEHCSAVMETSLRYQQFLATNAKHSTMQAAIKTFNCIAAKTIYIALYILSVLH